MATSDVTADNTEMDELKRALLERTTQVHQLESQLNANRLDHEAAIHSLFVHGYAVLTVLRKGEVSKLHSELDSITDQLQDTSQTLERTNEGIVFLFVLFEYGSACTRKSDQAGRTTKCECRLCTRKRLAACIY